MFASIVSPALISPPERAAARVKWGARLTPIGVPDWDGDRILAV